MLSQKWPKRLEREPSSLPLHKLYSLFRLHFTPEWNVHYSRADFFELKREEGESAADIWKRILAIEKKLRNWNKHRGGTTSIKVPLRNRQIDRRLRPQEKNRKKWHVSRSNHRGITWTRNWTTHQKQKRRRKLDTSTKEKQKAIKNKRISRPNSRKWTATDAEPRTGRDNTNVRPEERNAQYARRLAITQNVAEQIRK